MKYRIEHRGPCYETNFPNEDRESIPSRWIVEKVLDGGEAYTIASFREHGPAVAMMSLCASTLEAEMGATIEFEKWSINKAVA